MGSPHPYLKTKWEHFFYMFLDTNKNKVIDWNDFDILFEKIKETRGENSTEYKIVADAMRAVWKGLQHEIKGTDIAAPTDEEMTITVQEWNKMWEKYDPKHMQIWQWEYLKYMFFIMDTNGDKLIDRAEYAVVLEMYGIKKNDALESFDKVVADQKGKDIDWGQFVKYWNEYFQAPDRKAAGNWLFGPW